MKVSGKYNKFSKHALHRMFSRGITPEDVATVCRVHEVIKEYPEDKPYPSRLILGIAGKRPLHVVIADVPETEERIIITVYEPDEMKWDDAFQERIKQ